MPVTVQLESILDIWDEVQPLLAAHWHEVAHYDDIALEPDQGAYFAFQEAGLMRCFTARVDGDLVGYAAFLVRPNLHYQHSKQALQDVLFVLPEYGGRAAIVLIRTAERMLRAEGVQVLYHHAKRAIPRVGQLFRRLGYELVDEVYAKRLDQA